MLRINTLFLTLALSLLLFACAGKVDYLDNEDVEVTEVKEVMDGEFLVVHLQFQNSDADDINHSVYRVIWFDKDENPLEISGWKPIIVRGGATVYATERCAKQGAASYKIDITNDAR